MSPDELQHTGWPDLIGATVHAPLEWTHAVGQSLSTLDYFVVHHTLSGAVLGVDVVDAPTISKHRP
eukprot:9627355-Prorocentrum_lima.AAC.1